MSERHRLTDVDLDALTATCSVDGPVAVFLKPRGSGKPRSPICDVANRADRARSRAKAKQRRAETRSAKAEDAALGPQGPVKDPSAGITDDQVQAGLEFYQRLAETEARRRAAEEWG